MCCIICHWHVPEMASQTFLWQCRRINVLIMWLCNAPGTFPFDPIHELHVNSHIQLSLQSHKIFIKALDKNSHKRNKSPTKCDKISENSTVSTKHRIFTLKALTDLPAHAMNKISTIFWLVHHVCISVCFRNENYSNGISCWICHCKLYDSSM